MAAVVKERLASDGANVGWLDRHGGRSDLREKARGDGWLPGRTLRGKIAFQIISKVAPTPFGAHEHGAGYIGSLVHFYQLISLRRVSLLVLEQQQRGNSNIPNSDSTLGHG